MVSRIEFLNHDICHNTHVLKWTLLISIVLPFLYGWAKNDLNMLHVCVDMNFFQSRKYSPFSKISRYVWTRPKIILQCGGLPRGSPGATIAQPCSSPLNK